MPELGGTVGEELLTPTRIYVRPIRQLRRSLPGEEARDPRAGEHHRRRAAGQRRRASCRRASGCHVKRGSWPVPPVFAWLQKLGNVADAEMFRVFNMGVGFVVICARASPTASSTNWPTTASRRG